jgi:hypothetical protein
LALTVTLDHPGRAWQQIAWIDCHLILICINTGTGQTEIIGLAGDDPFKI